MKLVENQSKIRYRIFQLRSLQRQVMVESALLSAWQSSSPQFHNACSAHPESVARARLKSRAHMT